MKRKKRRKTKRQNVLTESEREEKQRKKKKKRSKRGRSEEIEGDGQISLGQKGPTFPPSSVDAQCKGHSGGTECPLLPKKKIVQ